MSSVPRSRRNLLFVLAALVALNIIDAITTNFLVKSEVGREANPFLFVWAGEPGFFVLKLAGALVSAFILYDIHRRYPRLAFWAASFFTLVYLGITVWNLSLILRS